MASCPAVNCTFLDQYVQYWHDMHEYNLYLNNGSDWLVPELKIPEPPPIGADADIAGLGVTTIYSVRLYV